MARVLIATDFSPNALNAALYAMELHGPEDNSFVLLNCYVMPVQGEGSLLDLEKTAQQRSIEGLSSFEASVRAIFPGKQWQLETRSEYGDPPNVIRSCMQGANAPQLVVMGMHGAGGRLQALFGSTTTEVIGSSEVPVLAVPDFASFPRPHNILLADDGGLVSRTTMVPLLDILQRTGARAHVVRMVNEEVLVRGAEVEDDTMEAALTGIPHAYIHASGNDLMEVLDHQGGRSMADIIAIVHRERGFLGGLLHRSLTNRLTIYSNIPLLVLHQPRVHA